MRHVIAVQAREIGIPVAMVSRATGERLLALAAAVPSADGGGGGGGSAQLEVELVSTEFQATVTVRGEWRHSVS